MPKSEIKSNYRYVMTAVFAMAIGAAVVCLIPRAEAQSATTAPSLFRIGEKLAYTISFGKIADGGYAELYVASRGKIGGKDVVEIHSKAKTRGLVSASFFLIDEHRTVYASPDTGLPVFVRRTADDGPLPRETVNNYIKEPASNFDLLTILYKAREAGGTGSYPFVEGNRVYTATFQAAAKSNEKITTDAGDFDTTVSTVQSDFFTAKGVKEIKINFTNNEDRIPVLIRIRTARGEYRASLISVQVDAPTTPVTNGTTVEPPKPSTTPTPKPTPRPSPSATPYDENKPLLPELGFDLGETLNYTISTGGKPVATITLSAVERKLVQRNDSLLLTATITGIEPANTIFHLGDGIKAQVSPDTLAPYSYESKFPGNVAGLNQTATFDQRTGNVSFGAKDPFDAPVGTHTLLSLAYAMRSFNLKTSKDLSNPVNDTRVSVFWENRSLIFVLRPDKVEDLIINGEKVSAQKIVINTGDPNLDALRPKVWLADSTRVPVRFTFGAYQADLIIPPAANSDLPK